MSDTSSVTSTSAFVTRPTAGVNKAVGGATTSFANVLTKTQVTLGLKSRTGFTAGPTYEANTLLGQTKAVFNNALKATKSALHIKP